MFEDLIGFLVVATVFATLFGIMYLRNRENMAIIEKGLNPRAKDNRPRPFINLKWGLLLMGCGLGLLFAFIIDNVILGNKNSSQTYISIEGGNGKHHKKAAAVEPAKTDTLHKDSVKTEPASAVNIDGSHPEDDMDICNEDEDVHIKSHGGENAAIYFALIAIGGGLGLILSYQIEKKEWLDKNKA